jgi:hypothetical protein
VVSVGDVFDGIAVLPEQRAELAGEGEVVFDEQYDHEVSPCASL